MKKVLKKVFYVTGLCGLLLSGACKKNDIDGSEQTLTEPQVVSSIPVNQALNVDKRTNHVVFIFDREILLVSKARVTCNDKEVSLVKVNTDTLWVELPILSAETLYKVKILPKAIKVVAGAINSDTIEIIFTTAANKPVAISKYLVVKNPSVEAQNVYNFLSDNYGKKIVSSVMANVNWNTNEAEWVKYHTGKYPVINTFDYIHLRSSPANWIDYSNTQVAENWWNNKGLIGAGWHWMVPTYNGSTIFTYKPNETTFDPNNATIEGTWENTEVKADLEKISSYLILLRDKNIPVIWRPLHEAAGNIFEFENGTAWFWWGSKGAEVYKNIWIYMFNYFEEKGLNNLIWVWTSQTKDESFYPGDEYVDIIGRDIYNNSLASYAAIQFNSLQETYLTKMVTLSECGSVSNISEQWNAGAYWSYFMPWYDYNRTNSVTDNDFKETVHEHAPVEWWLNAFSNNHVISRDQMPDLK